MVLFFQQNPFLLNHTFDIHAGISVCIWFRCISRCFGPSYSGLNLLCGTFCWLPLKFWFLFIGIWNSLFAFQNTAGWDSTFSFSPLHPAPIAAQEDISPISRYLLAAVHLRSPIHQFCLLIMSLLVVLGWILWNSAGEAYEEKGSKYSHSSSSYMGDTQQVLSGKDKLSCFRTCMPWQVTRARVNFCSCLSIGSYTGVGLRLRLSGKY